MTEERRQNMSDMNTKMALMEQSINSMSTKFDAALSGLAENVSQMASSISEMTSNLTKYEVHRAASDEKCEKLESTVIALQDSYHELDKTVATMEDRQKLAGGLLKPVLFAILSSAAITSGLHQVFGG